MMNAGTTIKQREIFFVPFPFTNLKRTKKRPVLVISPSNHNMTNQDIVCCGITSNLKNKLNGVTISDKDLDDGYLKFSSVVKPLKIFSIDKTLILFRLGRLNKQKSKNVSSLLESKIKIVE